MTVPANGLPAWTVIQFSVEFCEPPVVVASPGETTETVRIGVVTPSVAWVLAGGERGEAAVIYWHAIPATQ
jgi:hypothetical protein